MNISSLAAGVATVALLAVSFACAKKPEASSLPQKIDKIFADAIPKSAPGAAVLVTKNGRTLFQKGYGVRDLTRDSRLMRRPIFGLLPALSNSPPWR